MIEPWPVLATRELGQFKFMTVRQDTSRSPRTGAEHEFYIVEAGEWINIIPLTAAGKVVLIRQYRHGTQNISLEIPGGLAEIEDASLAVSAQRELLEETGYEADKIVSLGSLAPNPAMQTNYCHTFLALNVCLNNAQDLDPGEDIEVEEVALEQIPALIMSGKIQHSLVVAAFYLLEQYRKLHPIKFKS